VSTTNSRVEMPPGDALPNITVLLDARGLCKHYFAGSSVVRALDGVSLRIARGSFTVLTGPSGSGKTTLLALLGALERPTSGQILFQGQGLRELSDVGLARVRRRVGFVFQNFSLIPNLSAGDNVTYPLIPRGVRANERRAIAEEMLQRVGMPDKLGMRPRQLSGGEQQRVAIARALAGDPEVVLADEPISNLDPSSGSAVVSLLREIHAAGTTVVLATHDPAIVSLAGTVVELEAGKIKRLQSAA
jgi:putative ABC transport system ATP-binding protein